MGSLLYSPQLVTHMSGFFRYIMTYNRTRGNLETIRHLKDLRLWVYRYVAGEPIEIKWLSLTKEGYPRAFGPIGKLLLKKEVQIIKLVLTALQLSRVIPGWKLPDLSSITKPPTFSEEVLTSFEKDIGKVIKDLSGKVKFDLRWTRPHATTKSGPNGAAIYYMKEELEKMPDTLL